MTIDEFKNYGWISNKKCKYKEDVCDIATVDFEENLVGLEDNLSPSGITWVRCENIILLEPFPVEM